MKRKLSIAIICTSTVVVIISAYSYYAIDFTKETEPSSNVDDRAKTKRGAIIYQTKIGGDEWFMDSNLQNDVRFDTNANLSRNQDASWSVDSKEHTRLNVGVKVRENFDQKKVWTHTITA